MDWHRLFVTGGRGGCGKSTVAAGLACALTRLGHRVGLIDLDLCERSLDLFLGCEDKVVYDLNDLLTGTRDIHGVAVEVPGISSLYLIPGAYHLRRLPTCEELERLFSMAEEALKLDYLVVDTSSVSDPSVKLCAKLCDLAILVTTPGVLSARSTASMADTLHEFGRDDIRLVVNKFSTDPRHPSTPDVREMIDTSGIRLLGILPYEEGFATQQDQGVPPCLGRKKSVATAAFDNMALRLLGEVCPLMTNMPLPRKKLLDI